MLNEYIRFQLKAMAAALAFCACVLTMAVLFVCAIKTIGGY